jgi:hypothetical protein
MVRGTVEETLNAMLDAEADRLCGAGRYERSEGRQDTRAGSYERTLHTKAGDVSLKIPNMRRQTFETAIIERYRRRESSVEEALIEMYLAGVSVRRVEDITEALWGTRVSPSTVSNLNKKIYAKIDASVSSKASIRTFTWMGSWWSAVGSPAAPANAELAENGSRRSSGAARIARQKARTLLRQKLRRGPKPEAEIAQALTAAEIDRRDVLAACDDLGVLSCRGQWRLP